MQEPASYGGRKDPCACFVHERADALQQQLYTRGKRSNRALRLEGIQLVHLKHPPASFELSCLGRSQSREAAGQTCRFLWRLG